MTNITFINNTNIPHLQNPSNNSSLFSNHPKFNSYKLSKQLSIINKSIIYYHPSIKFNITTFNNLIKIEAYN